MRYDRAIQQILPKMKEIESVVAIFLKGSIARGENDEYSDLDMYVMLKKGVEIQSVYQDIIDALEAYHKLVFEELVEIICPQIVGVFEDMLHVDCYIVYEDNYPSTDEIKVLYDPNQLMLHYQKKDLGLTTEQFYESALDSCWFIFQYDHIVGRNQFLWTSKMIDKALDHMIIVLLHKHYPQKAILGKKAAHHLPIDIYDVLIQINDLNNSETHKDAVSLFMQLYRDEVVTYVEDTWVKGFEHVYQYLLTKYT